MAQGDSCDVLVLTVIGVELGAHLKALGCDPARPLELENKTLIWKSAVVSSVGERVYSVFLAAVGSPGQEDAAAVTGDLLARLKPRFAILSGIAAGLREKNKIGNVLIAENIYAYERGALEETGFVARPRVLEIEYPVRQRLTPYWAQGDQPRPGHGLGAFTRPVPRAGEEAQFAQHVAEAYSFKPATIASGSKLLRDGRFLKQVRDDGHGQVEAGEMEGAGFCQACRNNKIPWLVVRGISDFGDSFKNDDFHRLAADAAAACVVDLLKQVVVVDGAGSEQKADAKAGASDGSRSHHAALLAHLEQILSKGYTTTARFTLTLSVAKDYEALQRSEFARKNISAKELVSQRDLIRRLVVHSPGGAGKSTVLCQLGIEAMRAGLSTFFVDLKDSFKPASLDKEILPDAFEGSPSGSYAQFVAVCKSGLPTLLVFDGLNEVVSSVSEKLLREMGALSSSYASLHVVVADRMNAQRSASSFLRGGVDSLSASEIERHLPAGKKVTREADRNLLSMPFFLDLQLLLWSRPRGHSDEEVLSRQNMFFEYLLEICKVPKEELRKLAVAAHGAYRKFARRSMSLSWWKAEAGDELADALEKSGATHSKRLGGAQVVAFRHQLIHDFLVAWNLALGERQWDGESFDAATFEASSIEPLSFAAELLGIEHADDFVIAIYDWNYPAAIETVVDLDGAVSPVPVTRDLKFALTAVNAEKMLDIFEETAEGAGKRMARSGWADARKFADVKSMVRLLEPVSGFYPTKPLYKSWKKLFLLAPPSTVLDQHVLLVWGEPLTGWTAANVLRRLELSSDTIAQLRILYRVAFEERRYTVCWRVVHVLGRYPSPQVIELLKEAVLSTGYQWIRYGALRSLIEVAFRAPSERKSIFDWLMKQLDALGSITSVLREVRRTALVVDADAGWYAEVVPFLEAAAQQPGAEQEKQQWEQVIKEAIKRKARS